MDVIVEIEAADFVAMQLEEGGWKQSKHPTLMYRVDPARPEMRQLRHVAISHKKHLHAPRKQVSWNDDRTRHDRRNFDTNFHGMQKAKEIAITALKLADDSVLEHVTPERQAEVLVEHCSNGEHNPSAIIEVPVLRLKRTPLSTLRRALQILEVMQQRQQKQPVSHDKVNLLVIGTNQQLPEIKGGP